ncbi:MAG: hypothetical protein ABIA04_14805 [Pseudomonadota bacterium]
MEYIRISVILSIIFGLFSFNQLFADQESSSSNSAKEISIVRDCDEHMIDHLWENYLGHYFYNARKPYKVASKDVFEPFRSSKILQSIIQMAAQDLDNKGYKGDLIKRELQRQSACWTIPSEKNTVLFNLTKSEDIILTLDFDKHVYSGGKKNIHILFFEGTSFSKQHNITVDVGEGETIFPMLILNPGKNEVHIKSNTGFYSKHLGISNETIFHYSPKDGPFLTQIYPEICDETANFLLENPFKFAISGGNFVMAEALDNNLNDEVISRWIVSQFLERNLFDMDGRNIKFGSKDFQVMYLNAYLVGVPTLKSCLIDNELLGKNTCCYDYENEVFLSNKEMKEFTGF